MSNKPEFPMLAFASQALWETWLEKHHTTTEGIWIQLFKKNSGVPTVTYAQALDVALCYGWIDSQTKSLDEKSYLQKFTPRRARSIWSKINTQHIERLIKEGKMKPAGLQQVEEAKADGRWIAAYSSSGNTEVPKDFLKELAKNKEAEAFFKTLTKANVYAITWRLETAKKSETRERRMKQILDMLTKREKFH